MLINILLIIAFQCCNENVNSNEELLPSITITSPANNSFFSFGEKINFSASVVNGNNNLRQVTWFSDQDDQIGNSTSFNLSSLSLGEHKITVIAEFENDLTISSSVKIYVEERNKNAIVNIIPPEYDSLWYYNSESVSFHVSVTDTVGNPLTNFACKWISSLDGLISENKYFSVSILTAGTHHLYLTVIFNDSTISKDTLRNVVIENDPYAGTDLLNDKNIINKFDPNAPTVNEAWKEWTRLNSHTIRSLVSSNYQDLYFFDDYVSNARIVQMGEVSHGADNQNKARVRLIKYFHEQLGFDVVAFESGFYEAYFSDQIITTLSDIDAMRNSIASRWYTSDLLELMRYIKSTHLTGNPLHVAGFDVKPSTVGIASRPGFFRDLINIIDQEFAEEFFAIDTKVVDYYRYRPTAVNYVQANYYYLCQKYDQLIQLIENNYTTLSDHYDAELLSVALEAAKSAREAINNINGNTYYERDHQMAKTIIYLANELYANEKIIIWAHNNHVLEEPEKIDNVYGTQMYSKMMGKWLKEEFGDELYTIGTFSYRGSVYAGEGIYAGGIIQIEITRPNSLEAILYNSRKKYCYIDLSNQIENEGNGWMFYKTSQIYLHSDGIYTIFYKAKEQYDGILFIDTENPPNFIW